MLTLQEVKSEIEGKVIELFTTDPLVNLLMANMDNPFELNSDDDVIIRVSVNFGRVIDGEQGYEGVSRRLGVASFGVFTLWGTGSGRGLDVCKVLEDGFRRWDITHTSGEQIFFDDPYTEGGYLTESTKFCYLVHAPFFVWVGN